MTLRPALLVASLLPACATTASGDCRIDDLPIDERAPPRQMADLTAARPFYNYVAVTGVGPYGHHFAVTYRDEEPALHHVRVERDGAGKLHVHEAAAWWGGVAGLPGRSVPPPPPGEAAELARALAQELPRRCREGQDWKVEYGGSYREVHVAEFIAHDLRAGNRRAGWAATRTLKANETLTGLVGPAARSSSGFGVIEVPADARWVVIDRPLEREGSGFVTERLDGGGAMTERALAAARALASGPPAPALDAVGPPARAPLLPPGYRSRVVATVHVHGGKQGERWVPGGQDVRLPLDLRDAVFGPRATAVGEATLLTTRIKVRVTLTPDAARRPARERAEARYQGTLTVQVDDGEGRTWSRDYRATGALMLEGRGIAAPTGFNIPGASAPSAEWEARKGQLTGGSVLHLIQFSVDGSLFDDPRSVM